MVTERVVAEWGDRRYPAKVDSRYNVAVIDKGAEALPSTAEGKTGIGNEATVHENG
jgi:hypothetical protein